MLSRSDDMLTSSVSARVSDRSGGRTWDRFICLRCMSLMIPRHPKCIPSLKSLNNSVYHPSTTTPDLCFLKIIRCEIWRDPKYFFISKFLSSKSICTTKANKIHVLTSYVDYWNVPDFRRRVTTSAWRRPSPRTLCQSRDPRSTLPTLSEKVSRCQ